MKNKQSSFADFLFQQKKWELYCIFVKNGMLAPDALEKANAYLDYFINPK